MGAQKGGRGRVLSNSRPVSHPRPRGRHLAVAAVPAGGVGRYPPGRRRGGGGVGQAEGPEDGAEPALLAEVLRGRWAPTETGQTEV